MDYARIFAQAWEYLKRFKTLWLFGMMASCTGGGYRFNTRLPNNAPIPDFAHGRIPPQFYHWQWEMERFMRHLGEERLRMLITALIAVAMGLVLLFWIFNRWGEAGVLRGSFLAGAGQERLTVGLVARDSLPYTARLIAADLLILLFLVVVLLLLTPLVLAGHGLGLLLSFCCCLMPLVLLGLLYQRLLSLAITGEEEVGVLRAFGVAWKAFTQGFVHWLLIGVALFVIGLVIEIVLTLPLIPLGLGAFAAFFEAFSGQGPIYPFLSFLALIVVYSLVVYWPLMGIWTTYRLHVWALAYGEYRQRVAPGPVGGAIPGGPRPGPEPGLPPGQDFYWGTRPEDKR